VWNPNIEKDKSKLNFTHNQVCAPTQFKLLSKSIQKILELSFFRYFKLFYLDNDVDFYKLSESYSNLNDFNDEQFNSTISETEPEIKESNSRFNQLVCHKRKRYMSI